MNALRKICNWYFSRKALPYWCILAMDCTIVFHQDSLFIISNMENCHLLKTFGKYYLDFVCVLRYILLRSSFSILIMV